MTPSNGPLILAVLVLFGTAGLLALLLALAAWGVVQRRPALIKLGLIGSGLVGGAYLALLAVTGLVSRSRVLPAGTEKYFCELDCHLAYSVTEVRHLGGIPGVQGTGWVVILGTRFDSATISRSRPREAPLFPNSRRIAVVTEDGSTWPPVDLPPDRLAALGIPSAPLTKALKPGDAYTTALLFDLPAGVMPASLDLTEDLLVTRFLIGHERSPFHGHLRLGVPAPSVAFR
jgi:hypothetical protein